MLKHYKVCRVKCKRCGDVIKHVNRTKEENYHTTLYCSCGNVGLDPSATLYRIVSKSTDFEDLSEEWKD